MQAADAQLPALESVIRLVEDLGIDFWLAGGWAVDFRVGRITRRHSDVDLVVYHSDRKRTHRGLTAEGFVVLNEDDPDAEMIYRRGDLKVDVTFIRRRDDGTTVTPGWELWPWPADSFPEDTAYLSGVPSRIVSVDTLLASKTDWELNTGEPPRPEDLADIEILQRSL